MGEILISATILICTIMILRKITMGKISMCFRYALWFIVAARLVVPISFGHSPFSILNLIPGQAYVTGNVAESMRSNAETGGQGKHAAGGGGMSAGVDNSVAESDDQEGRMEQSADPVISKQGRTGNESAEAKGVQPDLTGNGQMRFLLTAVWTAGILSVGGYMLISQIRFVRYLHRARQEVSTDDMPGPWGRRLKARKMHLYLVTGLPSPCLVGRNIYIDPQMLMEENLTHIVAHEYTHAIHGDAVWTAVRSMLCAVYWFYPLIWLAAYEVKRDSELACDEHTVRILGEQERFAYGRTLLALLSNGAERNRYLGAVPIADGRKDHITERICVIAGKKNSSRAAVVFVVFMTIFVCGCAFTGAETDSALSGTGKEILLTNKGSLSFGNSAASETAEEERNADDVNESEAESDAFSEILNHMDDSGLELAEAADGAAYSEYLYENAEFPFMDGQWYQLRQGEENGIDFYGLYTQEYGFRGLKIKLGDDVNTFDQTWLPAAFPIDVMILEKSEEDDMPRSFVFKMCVVNSSSSEIWRLYVADRYDTGTIELSCFEEEDYRKQMEAQKISVHIERAEEKAELLDDADTVIGTVDISGYAEADVEEAVWDRESVSFSLEEEGDSRIALITGIGLKESGSEQTFYQNLPLINFPVEIGDFGDRKFTLGRPYASKRYVSGKLNG